MPTILSPRDPGTARALRNLTGTDKAGPDTSPDEEPRKPGDTAPETPSVPSPEVKP